MSEMLFRIYKLLDDVIVPHLQTIQASQAEQRLQTERLSRNLDEFRAEIWIRFGEIRAEIAACRQEVEDAMVTIREGEMSEDNDAAQTGKKRFIQ